MSRYDARGPGKREEAMPLSVDQMNQLMDEHFRYEATDDVDGVVGTLAANVTHDIVGWPGGISRTPEQARKFYEELFQDLAEGRVKCHRRLYGDNFLVDESLWEGRAVGRPFGLEGRERPLKFRILHVIEFTDDGRFASEQVWLDMAAIIQQLPQA
jgi:hypothetical protein